MLPNFKPPSLGAYVEGLLSFNKKRRDRSFLPASHPKYLSYSGAIDHLLKELLWFTAYMETLG